ncbi:hypothetical protein NW762_004735 [Fusarium torreyae]|uniref:Uncharacterized protein n=1 Tax=Fusarium torreyae TaxID=1237075 RepID=A0A9W8VH59_9HYPO|nr:hypothetical protein NW762_004735 [Fusarium torreyae]
MPGRLTPYQSEGCLQHQMSIKMPGRQKAKVVLPSMQGVSTINGSHPLGSGVADLEAKLERLPRLSAPPPIVGTAPSMNPDTRLPQTITAASAGPFYSGSPSDSILEARMMRRKHNHMSEDQSYLKPRDHFLQSLDRVHKRTISAPNPAQASAQPFPRIPTSLPPLASRHFEATALPSQQINRAHERVGSEQYPWVHPGESSPAPSMSTRSPFESQESGRILPDRSLQGNTPSYTNSNDRVITACRRFRKVEVNTLLEGGDICMAVEDCTTGSVPRKVISHLFGRNKVCTRRIPERVWVCMCRKHYQRIRYRTGADFSVTQIGMVYEQIVRMIFWSRGLESPSRTNQEGITIRSWTFSIRRREVKRLADTSSRDLIPHWIMQSLGEGKTHDEILDIVERLHHEIQQGTLKDVPPVEFLPEVVDAFTNAPAQLPVQISNEGEMSFANRPSRAAGEATESPISFVKESSPLEPVQEEGSISEHSSEQSSSSPTPPAAYNAPRPVYRTQPYGEDVPNRNTTFAFGSRSPLANSGMTSDIERRQSLAYHDSQNPNLPSMSYFSINRQMQAPVTDHQGSHDNFSYTHEAYAGGHHYGPNEFVLTDRNLSTRTIALPMATNGNRAMYTADYAAHGSRDNHNFYAAAANTQITPVPFSHPSFGFAPIQGQAVDSSYRYATGHHPQSSMNDADISLTPSTPDGRSYGASQHLQTHQPYWHAGETGPNTRIGRSMDQHQQHPLAYVDDSSLQSSHQFPKGFSGPSGVGLGTNEGAPIVRTTTPYRPRHHHSYATIGGPNDTYAESDQQTCQHSRSTSGGSEDWHGA